MPESCFNKKRQGVPASSAILVVFKGHTAAFMEFRREPGRIMLAIGKQRDNRWHLQIAQRWVTQYNFYVPLGWRAGGLLHAHGRSATAGD